MGFEFQLVAVSGSSSARWQAAGNCFASQVAPYVKASTNSFRASALNMGYELAALPPSTWREDFIIAHERAECHVCFHRGSTEQIESILALLINCCFTAGIVGIIEEL
jgi:hypothetical protein